MMCAHAKAVSKILHNNIDNNSNNNIINNSHRSAKNIQREQGIGNCRLRMRTFYHTCSLFFSKQNIFSTANKKTVKRVLTICRQFPYLVFPDRVLDIYSMRLKINSVLSCNLVVLSGINPISCAVNWHNP